MNGVRARALLGYAVILLAIVAGTWLLSLVAGDRAGNGKVLWFLAGALVGCLWGLRSRIPILDASHILAAAAGWFGLLLAGIITLSVAPTQSTVATPRAAASPAPSGQGGGVLKPAPPTAKVRLGVAKPSPQTTPSPVAVEVGAPPPPTPESSDATPEAEAIESPQGTEPGATPRPSRSPTPALLPPGFDPDRYLGQGNAYECRHFSSQAEAQAVLRADPSDPNVLDQDRDGVACESNPPPRDTRRVPRPNP